MNLMSNPPTPRAAEERPPASAGRPRGARRIKPGEKYGRWLVQSDAGGDRALAYRWNCRCDCGTERAVLEYALLYNETQSCGCLVPDKIFEKRMAAARERFVGRVFGWLTVADVLPATGASRSYRFRAYCACGSETPKEGVLSNLASGHVISCCSPAPHTEASQRMLLGVLAQLRDGATHYPKYHRVLRVLAERGAYDLDTQTVTDLGHRSLASGQLLGYIESNRRARAPRSRSEKLALVRETFRPGCTVDQVARDSGVAKSLLSRWRTQLRDSVAPTEQGAAA
ncbi:transposase [Methylibium petroleiphilum]|uniref:Transposase n=1 Tax=Methylibium petroleiphilum (strain ATCC BAA-1232 / LMG 22953 / PM1) TaxID=420662 RepID=A2SN53_METPP|nr:transposase [Methylibium petroleiphilum]ABM96992.1 hypothetical protein Mpe_B0217 [Methylibium petroleiphilum PM1]